MVGLLAATAVAFHFLPYLTGADDEKRRREEKALAEGRISYRKD